ncbi:MAG TPA: hypothetical protein VH539_03415 [Gemmatimonadaceae bacterium]|jgi:hypothetical protein
MASESESHLLMAVDAAAIAYRLYDIGYEIDLDRASAVFAPDSATRERPARNEAQALQIVNPPLFVSLGTESLTIAGGEHRADVSARLFDFGTCSLQLRVEAPKALSWESFTAFGNAVDTSPALAPIFARHVEALRARIAPAVERPNLAPVVEDYVVFRLTRLTDGQGKPLSTAVLTDDQVVPLLLRERRGLSSDARRELLPHRFSYYADDLTILTWENALVVEPRGDDRDVEYILEFANAQLLELRFYDAVLDAELPAMYDRIAAARGRIAALPTWRYRPLLARLQTRVADVTELVERVENALKVTDDVYLARIYAAALELFRGNAWRRGIERKLSIVRDTYGMLNAEAQAARAELLEIAIIALIVIEIVVGLRRG